VSIDIPVVTSHIRRINVRQDLLAVADLIEVCFATTLDADGREYLRHLRWAARDAQYLTWLQGAAERLSTPLYGFVWEEQGRIVGNLSLIPMYRHAKLIYLIANVAVHPNFRQRGIGRQLTERALEHLRERGVNSAWLQVRDDNAAAYHLYRETGFVERTRRTTWQSADNHAVLPNLPARLAIQHRRPQDWELQSRWLQANYPPDVTWNLNFNLSRIRPGLLNRVFSLLRGEAQQHWSALRDGYALGFVTWEPMRSSSDMLWVAMTEENEDLALQPLLAHTRLALAHRARPIAVNYPAGRAQAAFEAAGFIAHQTLVWMEAAI
jgi:ribosomal protein S18 acetylase RimI-like enzyme